MAAITQNTILNSGTAAGLVSAVLAAYLCVYGAQYVAPAWQFAHAEPRFAAVARGKLETTLGLDALIQALRSSPWRSDLGRAAFVQMLTAQQIGLKSLRATTRLTAARRDLRRSLSIAPSDAYAWTRLAVTELHLGNQKAAAKALSVGLQIAPAERKLTGLQFDLAVALWNGLDTPGRRAIAHRLAAAAKWPELKTVLADNSAKVLRERLSERNDQ
jgi:tetratricopeptide (TPR) repeat protein